MSRMSERRKAHQAALLKKKQIAPPQELKLNLGCGVHKIEGFIGVDMEPSDAVDVDKDLRQRPWPWKDNSVSEIIANYLLMYLVGIDRLRFMDEAFRILKVGAKLTLKVPYWASVRIGLDPLYEWPPITEMSFLMYNKEWREKNNHAHYPLNCDFDYTYGYALSGDIVSRNPEYQQMALRENLNAADDLLVTMIKRGPSS
jgi:hypothetical protein